MRSEKKPVYGFSELPLIIKEKNLDDVLIRRNMIKESKLPVLLGKHYIMVSYSQLKT